MRIAVLAINGSSSSPIAGTIESLNTAFHVAKIDGTLLLVTEDGKPINCNNGVILNPHHAISDLGNCDLLVLGPLGAPPQHGYKYSQKLIEWIQDIQHQGAAIASLCTGAFLFAATGLLDNRQATTHWLYADKFRLEFPQIQLEIGRKITEEDNLICSGGANAYLDLCLYIMEKYLGRSTSLRCAKMLLINPESRNQAEFASTQRHRLHRDQLILQVQDYLESQIVEVLNFRDVAVNIGLSERHFKRRFKVATGESPLQYLQALRIQKAKGELENTQKNIESISFEVGYEDVRFFRTLFKRHAGLTPSQYRNKFGVGCH